MKRVVLVLSALVLFGAADVPPARITPTFLDTLEVRLTSLDVVVTDRQGTPVAGLKSSDFEVFDDGQPQEITNFAEYTGSSGTARLASTRKAGPAGSPAAATETAAPLSAAPPRHFIFFVDDMSLHPQTRKLMLENVQTFLLTAMRKGDQAMIITPAEKDILALDFSDDRDEIQAKLAAYIKAQTFRINTRAESEEFFRGSVREEGVPIATLPYAERVNRRVTTTLRQLLGFIGGMGRTPGRKVLVLITTSLTAHPGVETYFPDARSREVGERFNMDESLDQAIDRAGKPYWFNAAPMIRELGAIASANGVTIYSIQPNIGVHLSPPGPGADDGHVNRSAFALSHHNDGILEGTKETLNTLASTTGGEFFLGQDRIDDAFRQLSSDVDRYYSIGYHTPKDADGDIHRLKVTVRGRPDLVVRTRRELMGRSPEREMEEQTASALFEPPSVDELGVTAHTGKIDRGRHGRDYKVDVEVEVPIGKLTFLPADHDKFRASFSVFYAAADAADYSTSVTRQQTLEWTQKELDDAMAHNFNYTTTLVVSPGTARVAVGVVDDASKLSSFKRLTVEAK